MQTARLAIVGDTQRVLPVERLAFLRETNDDGRRRIARAILADQLDGIVHLGDVIGSASGWGRFDQVYPPSELSNKQFHVCRGNHDCGGFWFGSPKEFNRRHPIRIRSITFWSKPTQIPSLVRCGQSTIEAANGLSWITGV